MKALITTIQPRRPAKLEQDGRGRMFFRRTMGILCLLVMLDARADGPLDNSATKVRPVPPIGVELPPDVRRELVDRVVKLGKEIETLKAELKSNPSYLILLSDIDIFYNAIRYALDYNEIFNATNEVPAARALLQQAAERCAQLRSSAAPWISATGLVVRGYRSKIDGSVQPYGLVVPASFQAGSAHRHRLDVWFHGRDEKLSELNFLTQRQKSPGEFVPADAIVLHTYGRYCNGQKFAGEIDLFEALAAVRRNYRIDENRVVVRGFSLGGAACWHFAVHHASKWAAAAPGAGFSETADFLRVFQNEPVQPPWYERKLWHLYDCTVYAVNLYNCPTVAYSGEVDKQKQAADIMAKALAAEGMELTHVVGPQTAHKYHPQSKEEINRRIDSIVEKGRNVLPPRVRFTTWTLRYNQMFWVTVDALQEHWERARIDAEIRDSRTVVVKTDKVLAFTLSMAAGLCPLDPTRKPQVIVDGTEIEAPAVQTDRSWLANFRRAPEANAVWKAASLSNPESLVKRHGLQGPIDDAFMDSFLMVRPTGTALNEKVGKWALAEFAHATNHWRKQFRGEPGVKDDTQITPADIAEHNLVLWGDPSSNKLIADILRAEGGAFKLPLDWDDEAVRLGPLTFSSSKHLPVLIYPNPLNPRKYVVLNSGFTFREYDYLNNARQVPKLPDYAVIDVDTPVTARLPGGIATAGFFGERWELLPEQR